ncbi:MAG: hypothetical protein EAZ97_01000 [Bacteroidetes bacterium]|nr:MAG: hypothetical protein EAZ97_01000 [Bacteroidota bacterium]
MSNQKQTLGELIGQSMLLGFLVYGLGLGIIGGILIDLFRDHPPHVPVLAVMFTAPLGVTIGVVLGILIAFFAKYKSQEPVSKNKLLNLHLFAIPIVAILLLIALFVAGYFPY